MFGYGNSKAVTRDDVIEIVANEAMTIRQISRLRGNEESHDDDRNIYRIYGYQDTNKDTKGQKYDEFRQLYDTNGYAKNIVRAPAKGCWRSGAAWVNEQPKEGDDPIFTLEDEMSTLKQQGLWSAIERADIVGRIGTRSALYVGVGDQDPQEPLATGGKLEDVYFSIFNQTQIELGDFDTDIKSERFGLPLTYTLKPTSKDGSSGSPIVVHHSRVVLFAEGALESDVCGESCLKSIFFSMLDYEKIRGGGAEAYFRNAFPRLAALIDKDAKGVTQDSIDAIKAQMRSVINKALNFLVFKGVSSVVELSTSVPDPRPAVEVCQQEWSSDSGMPIRILAGIGPGQLAGNEDKKSWNQILADRQEQFCEPIVRAVFSILETAGVIKDDTTKLFIHWPVTKATDAKTDAEIGKIIAETEAIEAGTALVGDQDPAAIDGADDEDGDDLTDRE